MKTGISFYEQDGAQVAIWTGRTDSAAWACLRVAGGGDVELTVFRDPTDPAALRQWLAALRDAAQEAMIGLAVQSALAPPPPVADAPALEGAAQ